ncbi:hypothetical protein BDA96_03G275700 [Sorghum bicolor]|uniref:SPOROCYTELESS-like EAR-containing protein 3 n=2 Tax=Sorghum bicolor TaxID=4558 RepID=A0A921UNR8_SORBI|nr:protein SPEAR1 isoform X3 [Sorghum bicolor]KAG0538888.1 hypothetical protein BDA96_03G275700 [Sorghum bicolor]KXG33105.1 hypothetical protein SORBI_3003G255200 [Sorghum bicolor]|eukprot:XP_002456129.2 protein SPEAR1 isoform X3 [Sorghum bicolor]
MSGSNFGDSMGWSSGRSSGSRRGKRGGSGGGGTDKPKQPQRGLGVAQLEKIRLQSEMAEYFHPLGQPPSLIHRTGSLNLMPYGERDVRYSEFQAPIIRSPSSSAVYGNPHYTQHPNITLPLFEPQESTRLKGHHDRSQSADSTSLNSDDPQDVDLELKL